MFERLLLVWLILLSTVAAAWNSYFEDWLGRPMPFNPFEATWPWRAEMFAVTMFAIGWMLPRDEVARLPKQWPRVLAGTTLQYLSMPLLAVLAARVFGIEGSMVDGVILVGCVPGAMASNVLTLSARGNVSYSVSLTTMATLLSPLVVPITIRLAVEKEISMPFWQQSWMLCWMVVLPVVTGHVIGRRFAAWDQIARRIGSVTANLVILWIIACVVHFQYERLASITAALLGALLCLNLLGYAIGYTGGFGLRFPEPMRRALTLEIGMQNAGLGVVVAGKWFAESPETAIAPAIYTFGCMLTGTVLATIWGMRKPDEN